MGLVGYSDSEGSDDEQTQSSSKQSGPQKLVSKSNPHKITVNLPTPRQNDSNGGADEAAPPTKRQKVGGGLGGFNAMLPAPKKQVATSAKPRGVTLGKGISLKTGAEPAFSRQPVVAPEYDEASSAAAQEAPASQAREDEPVEVKPIGNAMRFKPLSVARKPQKKKPASTITNAASSGSTHSQDSQTTAMSQEPAPKPMSKLSASLFPTPDVDEPLQAAPHVEQDEPMDSTGLEGYEGDSSLDMNARSSYGQSVNNNTGADTLDSIASDLNLSASARRQLLGRGSKGANVKVTNFNVNAEYNANEEARRNGEQAEQQNTVRSIAPGKHSLRQLVNAVTGQKEALEEQFASGRRNKKEAGSKYGW